MTDSPPALNYAPPIRRRWRGRLRTATLLLLLIALVIAGWAYGPRAYRHWQLLRIQAACLSAELPHDRPTYETDRRAAADLVAARPGEYQLDDRGKAMRRDARWVALANEVGLGGLWPLDTTFLHERRTPDGRRRLVVVESNSRVRLIEPGGWLSKPRVLQADGRLDRDPAASAAEADAERAILEAFLVIEGDVRDWAGKPDPADPSRFTIESVMLGVRQVYDCQLGNDDRVTKRWHDPDGFAARLRAALKAEVEEDERRIKAWPPPRARVFGGGG